MKLSVSQADMRGNYSYRVYCQTEVIDEDTGKIVGYVRAERSPIERHISLFDGKYQGRFEHHEECVAFAKGVEAVLNHMTQFNEPDEASGQAA